MPDEEDTGLLGITAPLTTLAQRHEGPGPHPGSLTIITDPSHMADVMEWTRSNNAAEAFLRSLGRMVSNGLDYAARNPAWPEHGFAERPAREITLRIHQDSFMKDHLDFIWSIQDGDGKFLRVGGLVWDASTKTWDIHT